MMFKTLSLVGILACAVSGRQINSAGLELIKHYEGFRGDFYLDSVVSFLCCSALQTFTNLSLLFQGIKTIGYGHACHVGDKCASIKAPLTEPQASQLLINDLVTYGACVEAVGKLNDDQFAALTSFAFNLGCESLKSSSLAKMVKAGDTKGASGEFGKWTHAGGKVLAGLVERREAERKLFCKSGGC